jgi:hypothetical protein
VIVTAAPRVTAHRSAARALHRIAEEEDAGAEACRASASLDKRYVVPGDGRPAAGRRAPAGVPDAGAATGSDPG